MIGVGLKHADNCHNPTIPYISLFSGYEGIGLGLKRIFGKHLRTIAYCEREAYACANLVDKIEKGRLDAAPIFTDVHTFPWKQYAEFMAHGILSLAECGAPHQRKRVFILAYDQGKCDYLRGLELFSSVNLANTDQPGPQRRGRLEKKETRREATQAIGHDVTGCHPQRWPARPGEPQHEWEEPRVLADPSQQLQYWRRNTGAARRRESTDQDKRKTQPGMGGAINGPFNRVDRLRLLGNGVVPATAEKAFLTLMNRIENPHLERPQIQIQMGLFPEASNYI